MVFLSRLYAFFRASIIFEVLGVVLLVKLNIFGRFNARLV
jgi:hypothetical protein